MESNSKFKPEKSNKITLSETKITPSLSNLSLFLPLNLGSCDKKRKS